LLYKFVFGKLFHGLICRILQYVNVDVVPIKLSCRLEIYVEAELEVSERPLLTKNASVAL
jgi:hypothetical protein